MENAVEAGQVAPAATGADQQQAAAAPETAATPQAETQAAEDGKHSEAETKTFTQAELDEIVRKRTARAEAIAERRALKTYAEKLERMTQQSAQQQPAAQQAPASDGKPKPEQFDSIDKYIDAVTDWKLEQREEATQQTRQQEQTRTLAEKTEGIYAEAQKIDGFDREAFDELPLTRHIAEALVESDAPAKLMAYMAANPDDVARIAGLSPTRQAVEMGKLEARLATAPKTSSAPPPIKPIGTRGSATSNDLSKASMDDYIEQRRKQGASWSR